MHQQSRRKCFWCLISFDNDCVVFTIRPPHKGAVANCGVYIGISYNEYLGLAAGAGFSTYTATGGSLSVAAGTCFF